jgi:uncharacterized OB-fold protein
MKPAPLVNDMNREYFEGCAKGELRVRKCQRCGAKFRFAYYLCPSCWSDQLGWEAVSGRGVVSHVSVVHQAPYAAFQEDAPYALVLVDLEEGVRMMSNVVELPADQVRIGMPVRVKFETRGETSLPLFVPA